MGKFLWEVEKMEGKGNALEEKITKYPVAPSEIRTHDLLLFRYFFLYKETLPLPFPCLPKGIFPFPSNLR